MKRIDAHLNEKLADPYFRELYEIEQQKLIFADVLIQYRMKRNLTQGQLAKKLGITQQYISKIENGEFSNLKTLEIILFLIGFKVKMNVEPLPKKFFRNIPPSTISKLRKQLVAA